MGLKCLKEIRKGGPHSPVSFNSNHSLHGGLSQEMSTPGASEVDSDQPVVHEESDAQSVSSNRSDNVIMVIVIEMMMW